MNSTKLTEIADQVLKIAAVAGSAIMDVYDSDDRQIEKKADDSPLTLADRRSNEIIQHRLMELTPEIPVLSEEGRDVPFSERSGWRELWIVDPLDGTKEFIKRNGEFTVNIALVQDNSPVLGVVYAPVKSHAYVGICSPGGQALDADGRSQCGAWKLPLQPTEKLALADSLLSEATPIRVKDRSYDRVSVVASRSHGNPETQEFIDQIAESFESLQLVSIGSSLKLCLVAEGVADLYPRYAPTMEWDTAAGHALVTAAGGYVWQVKSDRKSLHYNKENLQNPWFIARGWE